MSERTDVPPEIAAAYVEAKSRGLPDGWTCSIDKRNRRKWTAPNNGRSCDSIPKAIAISVELGLLPPDTVIPSGKNKRKVGKKPGKRGRKPKKRARQTTTDTTVPAEAEHEAKAAASLLSMVAPSKQSKPSIQDDDEEEEEKEQRGPPPIDMNPETTLEVYESTGTITRKEAALPTTVHWDPKSPDGLKVGWKVKIEKATPSVSKSNETWVEGRVLRYDPHTHKHKVGFDDGHYVWIWLRNEQHNLQLATRMVWAHVKGYAWWPALVMESNTESSKQKEGYVLIHFFGTGEISCLRDSPESVRDFDPHEIDPVVAKHRKKRNERAFQLACDEYASIQYTRNEAALYYARAAVQMASYYAPSSANGKTIAGNSVALIGKRVQLFRPDVNYPYGDTVIGKVRQYSPQQKKWLLSFEISEKQSNNTKYPPAWVNLYGKEHSLKVLDNKEPTSELANQDLIPFLFGFNPDNNAERDGYGEIVELIKTRCRGCVEYLKIGSGSSPGTATGSPSTQDQTVKCRDCDGIFHLNCVDPPLTVEMWQRMMKDGSPFVCSRCTLCLGCYQKDIAFGSHANPSPPPMLSLPEVDDGGGRVSLDLCSTCKCHYDEERFCPNCAHIWDDKKFDMIRRQTEHGSKTRSRRKGSVRDLVEDKGSQLYFSMFTGDDVLPPGARVDPCLYHPETAEWGYIEDEMLVCDNCNVWVHAGCSGLTEDEYEVTSNGDHPIYSKEFFCRMCCRDRCKELILALKKEDRMMLFASPVSEKVVPNYHDLIKEPMDLQTMLEKAETEEYLNYGWVREMFELMVLNALTFNRYYTDVWQEAKRFYHAALDNVFATIGKAALAGKYQKSILKSFEKAEEAKKNEEERVQVDESVEKKDLVAGSSAMLSVTLPKLRESPPDQPSCVPFQEMKMKQIDAFYCSWMDCCFTCGSSGAADTFLFCVDCGEAFHSFCANAPIHSMEVSSVAGWRCPNCKICEISGEVPADETCMLFCEMCDRGFALNLLDPPLNSAPSGLWICGQCVDCKECGNTSEKDGVSLRYWSGDPDKCFRCGGCEGLVSDSILQCSVCSGLLREDDPDIVECIGCKAHVHVSCDERAEDFVSQEASASRAQKAQHHIAAKTQYMCPTCIKPSAITNENQSIAKNRAYLSHQAKVLIAEGKMGPHANLSDEELHQKLVDEIDWATRNRWRDEYLSIVRDAIRIYVVAKTSVGDPRFVIQQVLQRMHQLPAWLGHRALRFAVLVKRKQWDVKGFTSERIDVIVTTAKLAAAFIDTVCRTLGINKEKDVSFHDRVVKLLQPPGIAGDFSFPFDPIKRSSDKICIDESGIILKVNEDDAAAAAPSHETLPDTEQYVIAAPLCGWGDQVEASSGLTEWKDPRECAFCHLCGDDDAGLSVDVPGDLKDDKSALGRLLPMPEGYWVHTSCALWSSEVWEAPDDGLVHAVEKARSRGAQLKCFGCGRSGATVGCNKSNCPYNYHFPCALACGAVFSSSQQVFCATHKSSASSTLGKESIEHMKALMVAPEKQAGGVKESPENGEDLCSRVGSLVLHSLGTIETNVDGFHSENYITPPGFVSSRIFWSARRPRSRTVYILKVEKGVDGQPEFTIIPGDDPTSKTTGHSASQVYCTLMERVKKANADYFSQGNLLSKLPMVRRTRRKAYGLNGPQFFGFGLDHIRRALEASSGVEAVAAPLSPSSPRYRFCFTYGPSATSSANLIDMIKDLQRKRAASKAEEALQNSSGCARTEGIKAVVTSGGSGRITRALVRSAEDDAASSSKKGDEIAKVDRNLAQMKYRRMKSVPMEQRLVARRSHIHGWGLFTKLDIKKYDPVVEYMGEVIRKTVADKREKAYELSGEGSCYMFRLDLQRIVDATKIGCMARFMNHSCQPNAYAKIMSVDTDQGQDRKIIVFANRDIAAGEEITYDYKFPVEDGSIRCSCGAPNCIGRLN